MSAYPEKPSSIATLEQELVRLMMAFQEVNPKIAILEDLNNTQLIGQWQLKQTPGGDTIFVGRVTIAMNRSALQDTTTKPWMKAIEVPGSAVVPTGYTTN